MSNDFNTTLAAMSAEEKVALLTGSGLWRTASLPQPLQGLLAYTETKYVAVDWSS